MRFRNRAAFTLVAAAAAIATDGFRADAQTGGTPTNALPNPYRTVENFFRMTRGRTWGSTSAVDIDRDGRSVWVAERCGANSCLDRASGQMSSLPPILKFDPSGALVTSFGHGMLIFPHGIHVDMDGNVWVTDAQGNSPPAARGGTGAAAGRPPAGAAASRSGPLPGTTRGHQVFKFSPNGKLLMTLGKPGGAAAPDYFYQPSDVLVAPNGTIFVAEGHGGANSRILKFTRDGKLITSFGRKGSGPGEFDQPHALAMDSRGRLFVGDRSNNRIQILRSGGEVPGRMAAIQQAERHLHRSAGHVVRGRFRVGIRVA